MEGYSDIRNLDVAQLQALVTKYPWFSYAREALLYKLVEIEPQCLENRYKESLVFFPLREKVLLRCRGIVSAPVMEREPAGHIQVADLLDVVELDSGSEVEPLEELSLNLDFDFTADAQSDIGKDIILEVEEDSRPTAQGTESIVEIQPAKPKIVVVGGDYFSKEDFAQLKEEEQAPQIHFGAPAEYNDQDAQVQQGNEPVYDTMDFVTETLAKIYADQGYYDKAIEVYAKLILLYPEKSTYFATLVNEIKSKN